jgi:hypothetical protein
MRKVIVLEHISLDGVIQAPGGPDEDTSGGFAYGGWIASYSDPILGTALRRQMNLAVGHLLLESFWANEAIFQLMMLAYHLFLLFKMDFAVDHQI